MADLARVETAQLQIELIPLLKRHISIDSLKVDGVTMQVRPTIEAVRAWGVKEDRPRSPYRVDALENHQLAGAFRLVSKLSLGTRKHLSYF